MDRLILESCGIFPIYLILLSLRVAGMDWRALWQALRARLCRVEAPAQTARQRLGARGEARAADYLRREKGFSVVERNWRQGRLEIDLVARDGAVLVFVEVRTRRDTARVKGYASVTPAKRRTLRRAIQAYLNAQRGGRAPHFRFDIVEIEHSSSGVMTVHHYAEIPLFNRHFF